MKKIKTDICIIGGGIIGSAIAREIAKYNKKTIVLEQNPRLALETSGHNSGLVHGGFDPRPETLNAKLNVLGKERYEDWIREMDFPYLRIDSIVVAFNDEEMQHVHMLYQRGLTNGLDPKEMQIIDAEELQKKEPNINKKAVGALVCNSSIAIDPVVLSQTLMRNAIKNGVELKVNSKVLDIKKEHDLFDITTSKDEVIQAKVIINAAGHFADELAKKAGYADFELTTRRGEYRILDKSQAGIVNSVVFMVPTIHGKGVIVAPMLDGRVMVGPTAVSGVKKEDTLLVTPEQYENIAKIGKKLIPNIDMSKTCTTYAGSRPIEVQTNDFWIKPAKADKNFINVAGMKSPAIASCPAIADMVCDLVKDAFDNLEIKPDWNPKEEAILPWN
ncbi:type 2 glycerol-3-phosphate oxidase [Mycoplasma putrefaciens]|uniref:Glycerol-3-phosphate oxidase n=1 Tax=Mycoplasma putrefaciens (strain ATCC 15718 / NCTC 10155 / C30 KS-1 / KS-1) TaxID=743965 RepID=A0A7U4E9W8_MYCPK|nr:type 2 glycerol-3-phosphate oxidase [Mycoplasma putrefaciens]AEM68925.1 glycerol-3-phosphate oxidase [Mycoplasma putrefaciens KS1]